MTDERNMRVVFMGTPTFAAQALLALTQATTIEVVAVYCQPPRPANRGKKYQKSAVQLAAEPHALPIHTPSNFRSDDDISTFKGHDADLAIVAAYGLILPRRILAAPRFGCVNIHASLLPRWRGAAPIHRAIEAGDSKTGVCLMQMDEGLDTGDVIAKRSVDINPEHTTPQLHDQLATLGADMIVELCRQYPQGDWPAEPQSTAGITYAQKINKLEARLDWKKPARILARQIRAFVPFPGSFFEMPETGERIKILAADAIDQKSTAAPGTVTSPLIIQCANQTALRVTTAQRAGKSAMAVDQLLRGLTIPANTRLD